MGDDVSHTSGPGESLGPSSLEAVHEELRGTTRELGRSEARFKILVTHNVDGVIVVGGGTIAYANPAAERLFGVPDGALVGRSFGYPITSGASSELDILSSEGTPRVVEMRVVETDWDGSPMLLASLRDVTEGKRLEAELRRSRRILMVLNEVAVSIIHGSSDEMFGRVLGIVLQSLDSSMGAFGYIDDTGALVYPSMLGDVWDRCPVEGKSIVFPAECWNGIWRESLHRRRPMFANGGVDVPEGHISIESVISAPIVHDDVLIGHLMVANRPRGYCQDDLELLERIASTISPVLAERLERERAETRRKAAERALLETEESLRQAQKMEAIGRLAGGVAHDFNNLLTVIRGYSDLLIRKKTLLEPFMKRIMGIKKAADRATELTHQLLAFSRRQVLEPKEIDCSAVIADMEAMLGRLIREDITLGISKGEHLEHVLADPGQLHQVVMNLVVNASDAMEGVGHITIETAMASLDESYTIHHPEVEPGRYVLISVSDTGVGIPPGDLDRIFEPFFTTKQEGKGTGLGLSTVYGIVKQSGGHIHVYSELGVGTSFKIYLPVIAAEGSRGDPMPSTVEDQLGGSETILVVEDQAAVLALCTDILSSQGYTVMTARNGEEALLFMATYDGRVDLVITDVVMPGMSGKEMAEALVEEHPESKILFMSGYTDDAIVRHGILDSDIAFVQKPFSPEVLCAKARQVLDD